MLEFVRVVVFTDPEAESPKGSTTSYRGSLGLGWSQVSVLEDIAADTFFDDLKEDLDVSFEANDFAEEEV